MPAPIAKTEPPKPEPAKEAKADAKKEPAKEAAKDDQPDTKKPKEKETKEAKKTPEKSKDKQTAKADKKPAAAATKTTSVAQNAEKIPTVTAPATAFTPAPPTAPPPVMLPGTQLMPSQAASSLTASENPTPLMAQPAILPGDKPIVTATAQPASGLPNVPYNAVQRWGNSEGAVPLTPPSPDSPTAEQLARAPDAFAPPAPPPAQIVANPVPDATPAPLVAATNTTPPPPSAADATEPRREISQDSKDILAKLPETIAPKKSKAATEQLAILRGKTADQDQQQADAKQPVAVTHDSLGIKIEVKAPHVNVDYELEKAYNALTAGNIDAATLIYKSVLENDANNKNALFGLATIYHRAGQLEKARPLYAQLLTIDPNNRDGLNNFLVLLADEAPEDALTHLETLRQANPDFSPIPAQMAVIYQKLGQNDKAIENMTRAIDLAPENLAYRFNFAVMLDKQKKYDEAAALYRQILQAYQRGDKVPGNIQQIQQRLTFISSNRN